MSKRANRKKSGMVARPKLQAPRVKSADGHQVAVIREVVDYFGDFCGDSLDDFWDERAEHVEEMKKLNTSTFPKNASQIQSQEELVSLIYAEITKGPMTKFGSLTEDVDRIKAQLEDWYPNLAR